MEIPLHLSLRQSRERLASVEFRRSPVYSRHLLPSYPTRRKPYEGPCIHVPIKERLAIDVDGCIRSVRVIEVLSAW